MYIRENVKYHSMMIIIIYVNYIQLDISYIQGVSIAKYRVNIFVSYKNFANLFPIYKYHFYLNKQKSFNLKQLFQIETLRKVEHGKEHKICCTAMYKDLCRYIQKKRNENSPIRLWNSTNRVKMWQIVYIFKLGLAKKSK